MCGIRSHRGMHHAKGHIWPLSRPSAFLLQRRHEPLPATDRTLLDSSRSFTVVDGDKQRPPQGARSSYALESELDARRVDAKGSAADAHILPRSACDDCSANSSVASTVTTHDGHPPTVLSFCSHTIHRYRTRVSRRRGVQAGILCVGASVFPRVTQYRSYPAPGQSHILSTHCFAVELSCVL